mgnify:CR=1 FL=1
MRKSPSCFCPAAILFPVRSARPPSPSVRSVGRSSREPSEPTSWRKIICRLKSRRALITYISDYLYNYKYIWLRCMMWYVIILSKVSILFIFTISGFSNVPSALAIIKIHSWYIALHVLWIQRKVFLFD